MHMFLQCIYFKVWPDSLMNYVALPGHLSLSLPCHTSTDKPYCGIINVRDGSILVTIPINQKFTSSTNYEDWSTFIIHNKYSTKLHRQKRYFFKKVDNTKKLSITNLSDSIVHWSSSHESDSTSSSVLRTQPAGLPISSGNGDGWNRKC